MLLSAASVAFAGSASLAAVRLLIRRDKVHRRSYIFVTRTFFLYLLLHGIAAAVPFLVYWFWPEVESPMLKASPWLVALLTPFIANQMLKLKGLDFPDATGPLSEFADDVRRDFEQRMLDEQFAAMRRMIESHAIGVSYFDAHALATRNVPLGLPDTQKKSFRQAIDAVTTPEEIMELYIRHIGIHSFRLFFKKKNKEERAQLLLFRERSDASPENSRSSARK